MAPTTSSLSQSNAALCIRTVTRLQGRSKITSFHHIAIMLYAQDLPSLVISVGIARNVHVDLHFISQSTHPKNGVD